MTLLLPPRPTPTPSLPARAATPVVPRIHVFSGPDRAAVIDRALAGATGTDGPVRLVVLAAEDSERAAQVTRAVTYLRAAGPVRAGVNRLAPDVFYCERPVTGDTAFVYTASGAAYPGVGGGLAARYPELLAEMLAQTPDAFDALGWVLPGDDTRPERTALQQMSATIFASALHTWFLQRIVGLHPQAAMGLSVGEASALLALGVWSDVPGFHRDLSESGLFGPTLTEPFDVLRRAWSTDDARWQTWRVLAPVDRVRDLVAREPRVHLQIVHTGTDCLIGGDPPGCARVIAALGPGRAVPLDFEMAIHAPEAGLVTDVWRRVHERPTGATGVRIYAGARAEAYEPSPSACAQAIVDLAAGPVDFPALVERAYADGVRIFVEQGPRDLCAGFIHGILGDREHLAVAMDAHGVDPLRQAQRTIAQLVANGIDVPADVLATAPAPAPASAPAPVGARTVVPVARTLDRARLEALAAGDPAALGPEYAFLQGYPRRIQLPRPPLLMIDRVVELTGEPLNQGIGSVRTETDVRADSWSLRDGRMPLSLVLEAGQGQQVLLSWLGHDLFGRGERVYRLLGGEVTYTGALPEAGDTLTMHTRLTATFGLGPIRICAFEVDGYVGGERRLIVRAGRAGLFTRADLDSAQGLPGLPDRPAGGDPAGPAIPVSTATPAGRLRMIDRIEQFSPGGGRHGSGYLRAGRPIAADDWFFGPHFAGDPVMPGSLALEGALQAVAHHLIAADLAPAGGGYRFEPDVADGCRMRMGGQIAPDCGRISYEVHVRRAHAGAEPAVRADVWIRAGERTVCEVTGLGVRLVRTADAGATTDPARRAAPAEPDDRTDPADLLADVHRPLAVVAGDGDRLELVSADGVLDGDRAAHRRLHALLPALPPQHLGDPGFRDDHGARYSYVVGEMANGIAGPELVVAANRAGLVAFFGAAGLSPARVGTALDTIGAALAGSAVGWGVNLIHTPANAGLEDELVDLFLARGVRRMSASAFLTLTPALVRYAATGLRLGPDGRIVRRNYLFGKVSRPEIAALFLAPAPAALLAHLVERGRLTAAEADLAGRIPLATELTVEADSGGHTDGRPLGALFGVIARLRDDLAARHGVDIPTRLGAAGGIGTPEAAAAAFALGAAYILTGSVNQASVQASLSGAAKRMLHQAGVADVMMAPSADMFELGSQVQVLRRGTMFGLRARELHELYTKYAALEEIPSSVRERLERSVFGRTIDQVWAHTADYFRDRDPRQVQRAERDPRHRMALVFRWYLGSASRWAIDATDGRQQDFQVWCSPAMGAFNAWTADSFLADPDRRDVVQIALNILHGAAVLTRAHQLRAAGCPVPSGTFAFRPRPLPDGG